MLTNIFCVVVFFKIFCTVLTDGLSVFVTDFIAIWSQIFQDFRFYEDWCKFCANIFQFVRLYEISSPYNFPHFKIVWAGALKLYRFFLCSYDVDRFSLTIFRIFSNWGKSGNFLDVSGFSIECESPQSFISLPKFIK